MILYFLVIKYEDSVFRSRGLSSGEVNKTILYHYIVMHKGHKEWLKKLHDKHHYAK